MIYNKIQNKRRRTQLTVLNGFSLQIICYSFCWFPTTFLSIQIASAMSFNSLILYFSYWDAKMYKWMILAHNHTVKTSTGSKRAFEEAIFLWTYSSVVTPSHAGEHTCLHEYKHPLCEVQRSVTPQWDLESKVHIRAEISGALLLQACSLPLTTLSKA